MCLRAPHNVYNERIIVSSLSLSLLINSFLFSVFIFSSRITANLVAWPFFPSFQQRKRTYYKKKTKNRKRNRDREIQKRKTNKLRVRGIFFRHSFSGSCCRFATCWFSGLSSIPPSLLHSPLRSTTLNSWKCVCAVPDVGVYYCSSNKNKVTKSGRERERERVRNIRDQRRETKKETPERKFWHAAS